jgi:microcystin-dependent protein
MWWCDTGNNLVKQRNAANTEWVVRGHLDSNGCIFWDGAVVSLESAATVDIGDADGDTILITGTTTITSFGTPTDGNPKRTLIFKGSLTLTYSASAIVLPGLANINVSAGDVLNFVYEGDGIWYCTSYQTTSGGSNTPIGGVMSYAGSTVPSGWLLCDGSAISRSTYPLLYSAIGTLYGSGDGSTTFNLPNIKDKFPLGAGSTYSTLGNTGGETTHILSGAEMPSHSHSFSGTTSTDGSHTHYVYGSDENNGSISGEGLDTQTNTVMTANQRQYTTSSAGNHTHTFSGTTSSSGSGSAHNNMPPYIVLNYIIKY